MESEEQEGKESVRYGKKKRYSTFAVERWSVKNLPSPTIAAAIAARTSGVGRVTVSLRRLYVFMVG
jgi:hypothetical protein